MSVKQLRKSESNTVSVKKVYTTFSDCVSKITITDINKLNIFSKT